MTQAIAGMQSVADVVPAAVFDVLPGQLALIDPAGIILRINRNWRRQAEQLGVPASRNAFVGASYIDVCRHAAHDGVNDAAQVLRGLEQVLRGDAATFRHEYLLCAEPQPCWFEVHVAAVGLPHGGAVIAHIDITDRKRAELLAARRLDELAHAQRALAMSLLSLSAAHDLSQPLTAILANAQAGVRLLQTGSVPRDELSQILCDIVADDQRAGEILQRIRLLLHKGERKSEFFDLNVEVDSAARVIASEALARSVRIQLSMTSGLLPIEGDPIQIQQVILNLMLNGLDAMNGIDATQRVLTVRTRPCAEGVELSVEDCGPGIPPERADHVFEPFYSTRLDSLGLGLTISRAIVEAHGGEISVVARPDAGSSFLVRLPVSPATGKLA